MMTVDDLAAISLFTGIALVEGKDTGRMLYILEKLEGRPVYTHEMPDIADKHKDELSKMVRDIYKRAKSQDKSNNMIFVLDVPLLIEHLHKLCSEIDEKYKNDPEFDIHEWLEVNDAICALRQMYFKRVQANDEKDIFKE